MFLPSPAFPQPSFEKVALYRALEEFLGDGHKKPRAAFSCPCPEGEPDAGHITVPAFCKKHRYAFLAEEPFFLGQCAGIGGFHAVSCWTGTSQVPLPRTEPAGSELKSQSRDLRPTWPSLRISRMTRIWCHPAQNPDGFHRETSRPQG